MLTGRVHSFESCGTVDGPGIRFLVFMQGCPLRCLYCHNADTWDFNGGKTMDADTLFNEIYKYRNFIKASNGGVTFSGGEPLAQAKFIKEVFKRCKENGIHTAVDTSGFIFNENVKELLELTDLVLLDIKSYNPCTFKTVTGVSLDNTIKFVNYLEEKGKPTWIRFVLVPDLTDDKSNVGALANFISHKKNIERVEILPFHKMGEYKWEELGESYKLAKTEAPSKVLLEEVKDVFRKTGIKVA